MNKRRPNVIYGNWLASLYGFDHSCIPYPAVSLSFDAMRRPTRADAP